MRLVPRAAADEVQTEALAFRRRVERIRPERSGRGVSTTPAGLGIAKPAGRDLSPDVIAAVADRRKAGRRSASRDLCPGVTWAMKSRQACWNS